jgi:PAS domain S-box-containing protein
MFDVKIYLNIINNLSILIALSVISTLIIKKFDYKSLKNNIYQGILYSLCILIIMSTPFVLMKGIIFDGRSIALSLSTLFFGPITGIMVTITALIYRIYIGGNGMYMGISVIVSSFLLGWYFYKLREKDSSKYSSNLFFYLFQLLVHLVMIILMIAIPAQNRQIVFNVIAPVVIIVYPIAGILFAMILNNSINLSVTHFNLKTLSKKYFQILDSIGDAVITTDLKGNITFINKKALELLNLSYAEVINKNYSAILKFVNAKNENEPIDLINFVLKEKKSVPISNNTVLITNKKKFHIKESAAPIIDENNEIVGVVLIFSDYTVQYNLISQLRKSEKKYKTIFNSINDAILIADINGIITEVNDGFLQLTGYKKDEVIGYSAVERNLFVDESNLLLMIDTVQNHKSCILQDTRFKKSNGEIFWGDQFATSMELDENFYFVTITKDITKLKNLEITLKESLDNYKTIFETVPEVVVITDIYSGEIIDANQSIYNILGYKPKEIIGKTVFELNIWLNADERQNLIKELTNNNVVTNFKTKFVHKSGNIITGEMFSKIIKLSGKEYILSFIRDITELEKAQNELIESENRFRAFFFLNPENILLTTIDGYIVETNSNFEKFTNIKREELIGKNVNTDLNLWLSAEDRDKFVKELKENGKVKNYHVKFNNIVTNGIFYGLISALPIKIKDKEYILSVTHDITEFTLLQEKIQEQNKRIEELNSILLAVINSSPNLYIYAIDKNWNYIVFSNSYKEQIFNLYKKELKQGQNLKDVLGEDIYKKVTSRLNSLKDKPEIFSDKINIHGVEYRYESIYAPIKNGDEVIAYSVFLIDITDKMLMVDELKEREKKLSNIVNSLPGFVFKCHFEPDYKMVYISEQFKKITGYELDEILDHKIKFSDLIISAENAFEDIKEQLKNSDYFVDTYKIKTKYGDEKWLFERSYAIRDKNGEVEFLEGYIEDVTERYLMEQTLNEKNAELTNLNNELFKINKDLVIAKEKIEESDRLKTAFLNNLNHEIRTPMNGIIGFSELLRKDDLSETDRIYYATIINQSAYRLLKLVNQIIELSKIDSNQIELIQVDCAIYSIAYEIINQYKNKVTSKGLEYKFYLSDELRDIVFKTDEDKIIKIIDNLIDNSLKFTTKGYVNIEFHKKDKDLVIIVEDTGCGISEDAINRVFERFFQANIELNRGYEGSGLGLSIVKEYVNLLNGKIEIQSIVNQGTRVVVYLPIKAELDNKNIVTFKNVQKLKNFPTNLPILIVDDDEFNNELLSDIMTNIFNAKVYRAYNGRQAVEILKNKFNIMLVFMDVKMPEMDGLEATREIRKFNKSIPIIGISAYANYEDIKKAEEAGMNHYIAKPFKKETIQNVLSKFFSI